jgi:hypothetical protein
VYSSATLRGSRDTDVEVLRLLDEHRTDQFVATGFQSLAVLAMAAVLFYLYRATRHRRPETPQIALVLALGGPIVYAGLLIALTATQLDAASDFVNGRDQSEGHAEDLLRDKLGTIQYVGFALSLSIGFAFVLIALNAMRAGLMSRFMGILGIIVGALVVFELDQPQFVRWIWLVFVGLLIAGRYPGGSPPAWETGRAEPWPTQQQLREQRGALREAPEAPEAPAEGREPVEGEEGYEPGAARRKRKKRR